MDKTLKWIIVKEFGSVLSKSKIKRNKKVLRLLEYEFITSNIDTILECLEKEGFSIRKKTHEDEIVKIYYVEPKKYKIPEIKNDDEYFKYKKFRNLSKLLQRYYSEKTRNKQADGLSKLYYRENTNYNTI
ncbi:hypothetical protein DVV91_10305 [Clostridium botulinum]|uniref:hypothetical protein n=1 Tax=Clostridium botulinum TaxID=1491 RepID=UPI001967D196|nr:hypothetical protein [Clostridium botulinum]MBN1074734.1 hypothetical protein [Clostridium botulinum]